jgi:hydrogenase maturation protein HypF
MAEHGLDDVVAVACDGYGYGSDGTAWGGEVLFCARGSAMFSRVGHLEAQPLLGGDLASRFPLRLAAAMLHKAGVDAEVWLTQRSTHLPHGVLEAKLIVEQLKSAKSVETTSCGRVLDAVSALLGLCYVRTYEGEPAMRLEAAALEGKDCLNLHPTVQSDVLESTPLIGAIYENLGKCSTADLAYSAHVYLAEGLASLAIQKAHERGVRSVGFTGGAAVNQILAQTMQDAIEAAGLRFVVHEAVPAGDGGVSFGQAVVAGYSDS